MARRSFKRLKRRQRSNGFPLGKSVPGDAGMHPSDLRQDPVAAQQALQQLVELGYIQPPDADAQKTVRRWLTICSFTSGSPCCNMAIRLKRRRFLKDSSAPTRERNHTHSLWPRPILKPATSRRLARLWRRSWTRMRIRPPCNSCWAACFEAEGHTEAALVHLHKAEKLAPTLPQTYLRLGSAYLAARQFKHAEGAFRKVLEMDSDHAEACYGLSVALMRQDKLEESVELALHAVGLQHHYPAAHFQLGAVLARLNQPARAALAFEHGSGHEARRAGGASLPGPALLSAGRAQKRATSTMRPSPNCGRTRTSLHRRKAMPIRLFLAEAHVQRLALNTPPPDLL